MKKTKRTNNSANDIKIKRSAFITVMSDAFLLLVFVVCLLTYISANNTKNYNQNVENVSNIATANSKLLNAYLEKTGYDVEHAYNYCNGKTVNEILDYLSIINTEDDEYQLLKFDEVNSADMYYVYEGFSTKKVDGKYMTVRYENSSLAYSLYNHSSRSVKKISYSQSFTNQTDALRYYSVFCSILVSENDEMKSYYLVRPQKENVLVNQTLNYSSYSNLTIALCYKDGKYLANDSDFKSDNFYDYLYKYNNLSIDEKNEIISKIQDDEDGIGYISYHDYQKRDCVFAYSASGEDNNLLVIVAVPESEFAGERLLSTFPMIIIIFLAILMIFNIYRLLGMVRELRSSVAREQIANASKSSFLSRMSHEIRTPLNAVIGYNNIARSEITGANNEKEHKEAVTKVTDCLEKSELASRHLLTVINDVLDMSAIESGKINIANDRFDFKGLINSLTTVFYTQAKAKGVDFEVVFDTLTEEWFVGDQMRINQVLTNLLSNAIKFTPGGGSVTLKINQPEGAQNAAHIHFEVIDTGIGMTEDYISHIWTPFEQADSSISRRFGGSGLGLSITKNLVDIMGGEISVDSKLGEGTTFYVDLTFGTTKQPEMTTVYDFSSVNALVVDDDSNTCDYIRLLFNRCGAKCVAVTSGESAVQAVSTAKENNEAYSVCLVDWKMPEMDGIETIRQIRSICGDEIPIIVLTAYDYTEIAEKASQVGVNRFISKPLFQSSLFDLLANICGTGNVKKIQKSADFDFNGVHIILAEDNEMNMEIASTILKSTGLTVDCVWNGREAVDLFEKSEEGTYDLILMDVHMPEMDGHEAARCIRSSSHKQAKIIPIIAMTADAFAENVAEAYAAGMNDHIAKPIDVNILFNTIEKYL